MGWDETRNGGSGGWWKLESALNFFKDLERTKSQGTTSILLRIWDEFLEFAPDNIASGNITNSLFPYEKIIIGALFKFI